MALSFWRVWSGAIFGVVLLGVGGCGVREAVVVRVVDVETDAQVEGVVVIPNERRRFEFGAREGEGVVTNAEGIAVLRLERDGSPGARVEGAGYASTRDKTKLRGPLKFDETNEYLVFRPWTCTVVVPDGYRGPVLVGRSADVGPVVGEERHLERRLADPAVAIEIPASPYFDESRRWENRVFARLASGESVANEGARNAGETSVMLWHLLREGNTWKGVPVDVYFIGTRVEWVAFQGSLNSPGGPTLADEAGLRAGVEAAKALYFGGAGR